jgi:hypothetical protein
MLVIRNSLDMVAVTRLWLLPARADALESLDVVPHQRSGLPPIPASKPNARPREEDVSELLRHSTARHSAGLPAQDCPECKKQKQTVQRDAGDDFEKCPHWSLLTPAAILSAQGKNNKSARLDGAGNMIRLRRLFWTLAAAVVSALREGARKRKRCRALCGCRHVGVIARARPIVTRRRPVFQRSCAPTWRRLCPHRAPITAAGKVTSL